MAESEKLHAIVKAYREGELDIDEAIAQLYVALKDAIWSIAKDEWRQQEDFRIDLEKDDYAALGLEAIWRALETWREDGGAKFKTYWRRIYLNAIRNAQDMRRAKCRYGKRTKQPFEEFFGQAAVSEGGFEAVENRDYLERVIATMTPQQQKIARDILSGKTVAEINAENGWAWGQVAVQLKRMRKKCQEAGLVR